MAFSLDLYTTITEHGPLASGAALGSPLLILLLAHLSGASTCIGRQGPWNSKFDSLDRFIRKVTMLPALLFVLVDVFALWKNRDLQRG